MKFKIYAGLGGGFGGANFIKEIECLNRKSAESYAYAEARWIYDSYDGSQGLWSYDEHMEEYPDDTEEDFNRAENEDFESWAEYHVEEVK